MRIPFKKIVLYAGAVLTAVYFLLPPFWMVVSSFMSGPESISIPPHFYPHEPTLQNYRDMFAVSRPFVASDSKGFSGTPGYAKNIGRTTLNSAIVAVSVTFLNLLLGSLAAYAFARLRFRGDISLLFFYLATRMVPPIVLVIPIYLIIFRTGLVNTYASLIATYTTFTLPFTIWMLRSYFQTVPRDLEDAARVDRCNWVNMMLRVFLPVAAPGLVAAGVYAFLSSWSEFLYAAIFATTIATKTVPVMVAEFSVDAQLMVVRPLIMASGVVAIIPPIVLALIFQHLIVQGLVAGSVKG